MNPYRPLGELSRSRLRSHEKWLLQINGALALALLMVPWCATAGPANLEKKPPAEEEVLLQKRIQAMKADRENLFYARSKLPPAEQERIAQSHLAMIQKLSEVGAFESPDHEQILEHTEAILRQAPDSLITQVIHWNLHTLYLTLEKEIAAAQALESYLDKYPKDAGKRWEAYDRLSVLAQKRKDWGAALYYSDKLLEMDPGHYAMLLAKATALLQLGDREAGRTLLERIIREDPESVQFNLATAEMDRLKSGAYDSRPETEETGKPGFNRPDSPKTGGEPADSKQEDPSRKSAPRPGGGEPSPVPDPLQRENYRQTMERMRQLAQGVGAYFMDNGALPSHLPQLLEERYAKEEFMQDAWGRAFHFKADPAQETCWIASAGSDGRFLGFDQKGAYPECAGQDIIVYDMKFVLGPDWK